MEAKAKSTQDLNRYHLVKSQTWMSGAHLPRVLETKKADPYNELVLENTRPCFVSHTGVSITQQLNGLNTFTCQEMSDT